MGTKCYNIHLGELMLTNEEKIDIIIDKLNKLDFIIKSFIDHAEEFKDKYSLEDELADCNAKKAVFISMLEDLGYLGYESPIQSS